ncbi:MAG: ribonuclease HI family protein [Candidatus Margulisiibacteriota bacterium]
MPIEIYTDGAARGNPGPAGIGVVIRNDEKVLLEIADYIGETTNNIAEYTALIRGLEEAIDMDEKQVRVFSDSELIVKQVNGEYRVKNEGLAPLHNNVKALTHKFKKFEIFYISRDNNKAADKLANRGIDEH